MRNTWLFVVLTLLLVAAAWWQFQLVQNLRAPLPVPESSSISGKIERVEPINESTSSPLWTIHLEGSNQTVRLDHDLLSKTETGDRLSLALPNGDIVDASVSNRIQRPSGNIHLDTHYDHQGQRYPLLLTQSENQTFATLSTAEGVYELSAKNGIGSLTKSIATPTEKASPDSAIMPPD